jgi:monofunctional biosynthetic peptidoglycan transglycosylase
VIETGPGLYGAEAAARRYFAKPAAKLTPREAALIASILPAPLRRSPAKPTRYLQGRARVIETRVGQLGTLLDCAP